MDMITKFSYMNEKNNQVAYSLGYSNCNTLQNTLIPWLRPQLKVCDFNKKLKNQF